MKVKLQRVVNVCQVLHEPAPNNWRYELLSSEGSWTLDDKLTRAEAIDRALDFQEFSGLPAKLHGVRIIPNMLESPE